MKRNFGFLKFGLALMVSAASSLTGCSKSTSSSKSGGPISVRIVPVSTAQSLTDVLSNSLLNAFAHIESIAGQVAPKVAGTTATSLKSLKYFIREVQICKNVVRNGSGFSSTEGCITIYANAAASSADYANYNINAAMADQDPNHWIDFMSAESRAKLSANPVTLTSDQVGSYNYGLINFMTPIKITAEFKDSNGTVRFVTKTPTAAEIKTGSGAGAVNNPQYVEYADSRYTSGAAEELTVQNNNGGTILSFLKPFEITQADVDNKTAFNLDFVFNPDSFATADESGNSNCTNTTSDTYGVKYVYPTNCTSFSVPMGKLAPLPHKSTEAIKKEVYLVTNFAGGNDMRIELYYNDSDASKAIIGMDRSSVVTANSTASGLNALPYGYRLTESNGSVTFYGYNQATKDITFAELSGLVRRTNGTLTLNSSLGGSSTLSYSYQGTQSVSTN